MIAGLQIAALISASSVFGHCCAQVVYQNDFEIAEPCKRPEQWTPFHSRSAPNVTVECFGADSAQCLRGRRSNSGGWTALSREFEPQPRVMIEFSFAFSKTIGRSLNVWTHEPNGKDASQFNICIQNGILMQYDGRTRSWEKITGDVVATKDPEKPVWHRLRAVMDADQSGIDFWISGPLRRQFFQSTDHPRGLPHTPADRSNRFGVGNTDCERCVVPDR